MEEFKTSDKDVMLKGLEDFHHVKLETFVASSFKSMDFDNDLKLGFDCREEAELCLLIMLIGHKHRASATFVSKDGSKLFISRQRDAPVTRKCKQYDGKRIVSSTKIVFGSGHKKGGYVIKVDPNGHRAVQLVPGSSHGRRLLQGGGSQGDS